MSYEQLLAEVSVLRPRTAAALRDAERRRRDNLNRLLHGARLAGVEQLLLHLDQHATAWTSDGALTNLAFLPARAVADFETAVEATFSGYLAVASDAMRDVMEIENLLLDFSSDPALVEQWLTADAKTLRRQFSADAVRKRLHKAGVGRYQTSAEARDYQAHSATLHVTPTSHSRPLATEGRVPESSFEADAGFWEIFQHARRLLVALGHAGRTLASEPGAIPTSDLLLLDDAWRRTQEMLSAYVDMTLQQGAYNDDAPGATKLPDRE